MLPTPWPTMNPNPPAGLDMSDQVRVLADSAINGYQWLNSGGILDVFWFIVTLVFAVGIVWSISSLLMSSSGD